MKKLFKNVAILLIVIAMIAIFVAVMWMNRRFFIKRTIVILAYTAIVGIVALLLHLSDKKR